MMNVISMLVHAQCYNMLILVNHKQQLVQNTPSKNNVNLLVQEMYVNGLEKHAILKVHLTVLKYF